MLVKLIRKREKVKTFSRLFCCCRLLLAHRTICDEITTITMNYMAAYSLNFEAKLLLYLLIRVYS